MDTREVVFGKDGPTPLIGDRVKTRSGTETIIGTVVDRLWEERKTQVGYAVGSLGFPSFQLEWVCVVTLGDVQVVPDGEG